ncbi:E3 ubiquitin-protein ligase UBR2 [Lamellibrachia satsuma]|nr:E3 ubiquitin-protein ligase UBR2 [Lamellibrachia satsuma]
MPAMTLTDGRIDGDAKNIYGGEKGKAQGVLFKPLEVFICGGDPTVVFQQLKNLDSPPQLCGKVFKNGEPTYACRDCGMDPTCVLCIECFQNSAHKTHRYKMNTSGGGGYCDCGDVEAWKTEPFCNVHKKGVETQKKNPVDNLPAALRQRACQLFRVAVEYAADLLTWTECNSLPDGLRGPHTNNVYITMLFNDEVHTYEQVITTLERAVDCTHKEAIDFATTVDREGRSSVKHGSLADCNKAMQVIEKNTSRLGSNPLLVRVMHSSVVGHQQFALKILYWLNDVISQSDGLRQLFCQLSMQAVSPGGLSVVERMMLADTKLWKAARIQSHQLFMAG